MRSARLGLVVGLALAAQQAGAQTIGITSLPTYGTLGDLSGQVTGVDPASHHVATWIQIEGSGWWTKPTLLGPTVPIAANGSFSVNVGTGGPESLDDSATIFCVALLPLAESPPTVSGGPSLPQPPSLASDCQERYARTVSFADREWGVKQASSPVGPGDNLFSDRVEDVFVDVDGLHLIVDQHDDAWWSVEVILLDDEDQGTWLVQTASRLDVLDPNLTLAIFTWDAYGGDDAVPGAVNREIDFEDSRWGIPGDPTNAQWVVQPWNVSGNLARYTLPDLSSDAALTRFFSWVPGGVQFTALLGHHDPCCFPASALLAHGLYLADASAGHFVPSDGRERLRLSLWINAGGQPAGGQPVEVLVSDVVYLPEPAPELALAAGGLLLAGLARRRQSATSGEASP